MLCLSFGVNAFAYCTQEQIMGYAQDTIIVDTNGVEDYNAALFCADKAKAAEHFAQAAQAGHIKAQYNLGELYEEKLNNKEKAIYWYEKSFSLGDNDSEKKLIELRGK